MASINVVTDIESKTKATKHFNFTGILFVFAVVGLCYMLKENVNTLVRIPFYIFNGISAAWLMLPSKHNKGRNNLESIAVMLRKDPIVYRHYTPEAENDGQQ